MARRIALLVFLLFTGCTASALWEPDLTKAPVAVSTDELLTDWQAAEVEAGVEYWNTRVGFELFRVVDAAADFGADNQINISNTVPPSGAAASSRVDEDQCTVFVAKLVGIQPPNMARVIIAHELGHCLGFPHDNDPHSLMYSIVGLMAELLQPYIDAVREKAGVTTGSVVVR